MSVVYLDPDPRRRRKRGRHRRARAIRIVADPEPQRLRRVRRAVGAVRGAVKGGFGQFLAGLFYGIGGKRILQGLFDPPITAIGRVPITGSDVGFLAGLLAPGKTMGAKGLGILTSVAYDKFVLASGGLPNMLQKSGGGF